MDKKFKQNLCLIAFGVLLFAAVMNLHMLKSGLEWLLDIFLPVLLGFMFAFILNVPMRAIERLIFRICVKLNKSDKKINDKIIRLVSLVVTFICLLLVIALVVTLVVPALITSVKSVYALAVEKWPEWSAILASYNINTEKITQWLQSDEIESVINTLVPSIGNVVTSAVGVVGTVVSGISSIFISIVISIYVLLSKETLQRQALKLLKAFSNEKISKYILHVSSLINKTYSKFLSGQCVESIILGVLIFIAYSVFGIPYAGLTGVLTAVLAFIPYVGAFGACAIGGFLVLLSEPSKFIISIIIYLVVQFIENQFIYPHVVGSSVGMSPLWTIIAVLIGGSLMGLFGMIFFIPLMAVMLTLIGEIAEYRIKIKKKLPQKNKL